MPPRTQQNVPPSQLSERRIWTGTTKRSIILTGLCLLIAFSLTWVALSAIKARIASDHEQTLMATVQSTEQALYGWVSSRINGALTLATDSNFQTLVKDLQPLAQDPQTLAASPALSQLRQILTPWLERHHDLGFYLLSPDGIQLAALDDQNLGLPQTTLAQSQHLQSVLKGNSGLLLPDYFETHRPASAETSTIEHSKVELLIGIPITDHSRATIAALFIRIDPCEDFCRTIQFTNTGQSRDTYAFDQSGHLLSDVRFINVIQNDGRLLPGQSSYYNLHLTDPGGDLSSGFRPETRPEQWPLTLAVAQATAGKDGFQVSGYRNYRGAEVIGAWRWLDHLNLGLLTELDVSEAYATYHLIFRIVLILCLVTGLLFMALVLAAVQKRRSVDRVNTTLRHEIKERQQSEYRFQHLLNSSPDGLLIIDQQGEILLANPASEQMFGYPATKLLGRSIETLVPDRIRDQHPQFREQYFEALAGNLTRLEVQGQRLDKSLFPVEIHLNRVLLDQEPAVIAAIRDLSARTESEEKIRLFRRLAESSGQAMVIADLDAMIRYANPRLYQLLGMESTDALLGTSGFAYLPENQSDLMQESILPQVLEEGQWTGELPLLAKNGRIIPVLANIFSINDDAEQPQYLASIITDLSEIKATEQLIMTREQRLRKHKLALQFLARSNFNDLMETIRIITEQTALALECSRVSIWLMQKEESELACQDLFIQRENRHVQGFVRSRATYPIYFRTLDDKRIIVAHDTATHPATSEFRKTVLEPLEIKSMLNSSIILHSRFVGAVCCQQVGEQRHWEEEEETFVSSIADIMTLALESNDRRLAEKQLSRHQEDLERVINQRTADLQQQIDERKKIEQDLLHHLDELERFTRLAQGREQKMIELKQEVNQLSWELDRPPGYPEADEHGDNSHD